MSKTFRNIDDKRTLFERRLDRIKDRERERDLDGWIEATSALGVRREMRLNARGTRSVKLTW